MGPEVGPPGKGLQRAGTDPRQARAEVLSSPLLYTGSARSTGTPGPAVSTPESYPFLMGTSQWAVPLSFLVGWD